MLVQLVRALQWPSAERFATQKDAPMNKLFFALPLVISLGACGGELAPKPIRAAQKTALRAACMTPTAPDFQAQSTLCPGSNRVYGIDVSYYQGNIDWGKVRAAGKQFAIIRVSDGTGFRDPKFETTGSRPKTRACWSGPISSSGRRRTSTRRRI